MYPAGELLPVHAVAGSYRVRSHFEAQDYMESGADHRMTSGWLNRVVAAMPKPGGQPEAGGGGRRVDAAAAARAGAGGRLAAEGFAAPPPDLYAQVAALRRAIRLTGRPCGRA